MSDSATPIELARQLAKEIEAENRHFILRKDERRPEHDKMVRDSRRHLAETYVLLARIGALLDHR
jgi:hypothetical protein